MTTDDPELFVSDKAYYISTWSPPFREVELTAIPVEVMGHGLQVELTMSEAKETKGPRYCAQSAKDVFTSRQVSQIELRLDHCERDVERLRTFAATLSLLADRLEVSRKERSK